MITFPNAKINIGLNVVSKRDDGFHNLETIFYPVGLSDALEINYAKKTEISFSGIPIDAEPEKNLVFKAYDLLKEEFTIEPVKIHLHKNIPFGAGLGGGSSDAAFALKMLNSLFSLQLSTVELEKLAGRLGADCAFFIKNQPTFAYGKGDQFKNIHLDLSEYKILLAKPAVSVGTSEAYRNIIPHTSEFNLTEIGTLPVNQWKNRVVNDFEKTVFELYPEIENLKQQLYQMGAVYAAMTGSGSAVFGIFRHLPTNTANYLPKGIFIYR